MDAPRFTAGATVRRLGRSPSVRGGSSQQVWKRCASLRAVAHCSCAGVFSQAMNHRCDRWRLNSRRDEGYAVSVALVRLRRAPWFVQYMQLGAV